MIGLRKYFTYTIENCVIHDENTYYIILQARIDFA